MATDTETEGPPGPRENPDLLGHEGAERALLDSYRSGRLAHAWLICGPPGIGKATLAFRFARFLLAQGAAAPGGLFGESVQPTPPESLFVDPADPVFHRVASGGHADLLTVERRMADGDRGRRRTEIVVDDVRGIGGFFAMTSAEGGWRVVIIDSADEMNRNATNAVLKVLEEPPPRGLLLLVSHAPGRLLPTVRSRCRRLVLKPLPTETVAALLTGHAPDLPAADAAALAALSEGSIGRALVLAEEGGLDLYRDLMGLLEGLPRLDIPALHKPADRLARADGEAAYRTVAELLRAWLARLIRSAAGAGEAAGDGPFAREGALTRRLGTAASLDRWLEVWEKISRLLARAEGANLDRKQVVLNALLAIEDAVRR